MVWTQFWDMHSGGSQKLKWSHIYIEAPQKEAEIIFQNRFGRNPHRVTCTCCGSDYSISESGDLAQATAFERKCRYAYFDKNGKEIPQEQAWKSGKGLINGAIGKYVEGADEEEIKEYEQKYPKENWKDYFKFVTLSDYKKKKDVLIISKKQIKPKETKGKLKEEGYVWVD